MSKILMTGMILLAISIAGFACIQFITQSLPTEFIPLPPDLPLRKAIAFLSGTIMVISAAGLFIVKLRIKAALAIGILFFIFLLYPQMALLLSDLYQPGYWVAFLETLCFCCGSFVLASLLYDRDAVAKNQFNTIHIIARISRYLIAVSLIIFGIQHIMYEDFILTLIPSWIPAKIFWAHIVKAGFILTGISLLLNIQARLSSILLGCMFLIWALILHASRVAENLYKEPEWTSLFVACGMSGVCFILATYADRLRRLN